MKHLPKRFFLSSFAFLLCAIGLGLVFAYPRIKSSGMVQPAPHAKEQQSENAPNSPQPELKSLDPYSIEWFIEHNRNVSLKPVWQRLGVTNDPADGLYEHALEESAGCKARVYEYDIDGEPGKEVLLHIEERLLETCRYLIFKKVNGDGTEATTSCSATSTTASPGTGCRSTPSSSAAGRPSC